MIRTYKRKLILNVAQQKRLDAWIGTCRFVYNMALEIRITAYRNKQQRVTRYDLIKQLPSIKNIDWVADVPAESLQGVIERLDISYEMFFRNFKRGCGFPSFASKRKYKSILFKRIKVKERLVCIPKMGKLRMVKDMPISGTPKTATIIKEPTGFFICIQCENVPKKFNSENQAIGLDMGIAHFCVDSNGGFIANPRYFKKYEQALRIANRSLARKLKGSKRWKKQAKALGILHYKIANMRKDFLHKESTQIAKKYSTVYIEDLKIGNMVKNKNLSKHILDCGWGIFRTMLEYKTHVVRVCPNHTSQTCLECGLIDSKSRISQSDFCCTGCGYTSNADINAAKNILRKGIALDRQREALVCA